MRTTREDMKRRHDEGKENQRDVFRKGNEISKKMSVKRNKGLEPSMEFKKKFGLSKA